jgi:hypothetical protein
VSSGMGGRIHRNTHRRNIRRKSVVSHYEIGENLVLESLEASSRNWWKLPVEYTVQGKPKNSYIASKSSGDKQDWQNTAKLGYGRKSHKSYGAINSNCPFSS